MATTALYHFNGDLIDQSANGFDLSSIGSPSYGVGKFGQGLTNFNASVSYAQKILTPVEFEALFGMVSDVTIELFCKITTFDGLIFSIENDFGYQLIINKSGSNLTCSYAGNYVGGYNITSIVGDGNFHHIAFVRNGSALNLYLDGIAVITGTTAVDISLGTFYNMSVGYGLTSLAVVDELRVSDIAVYTTNFTPPTTQFQITTTPLIRAKQTVGDKWIISLLQDPTDGLGVSAPLGSIAQVNASGISSIWLKSGALDSDWVKVNTGISENGWNVAYSLATLDDVTADAYFGTNGTTFNGKIIFARHGTVMMEFNTSDQVKMSKNTIVDYASGQRVSISDQNIHFIQDSGSYDFFIQIAGNEFQIDATNNLIVMRATAIHERLDSANSFKNRFYNNHNGSSYEQMAHADNFIVSNVATNMTFNRVHGDYSNNDIVHGILTVVLRGTVDGNLGSVVFKKDYHVMNKQIIFDQDSFTSQDTNADVADLLISDFSYASQTFTVALKTKKNGKTMQSTYAKVFIEEKVMNF